MIAEAEQEGLEVRRLRMSEDSPRWEPIRSAIRAVAPARRARRHRLLETAEPLQPPPPFHPERQLLAEEVPSSATEAPLPPLTDLELYAARTPPSSPRTERGGGRPIRKGAA